MDLQRMQSLEFVAHTLLFSSVPINGTYYARIKCDLAEVPCSYYDMVDDTEKCEHYYFDIIPAKLVRNIDFEIKKYVRSCYDDYSIKE